jgi:class 3 adenylate cyclase/predicted negative regulator of RcsB-dependent stress response
MDCPDCRHANEGDARFCERCGNSLVARCPACGRDLGRGARFCAGCGRAVEAAAAPPPAPPDADRRPLTVVFCDLVRSTELSARLDPEEWGEALGAYQKAAGAMVIRYGGHVAQHLGDGLLAYFGWPHALDDAPERAVRAGLGLVDAAAGVSADGQPLRARVGVHTGMVVVGALGEGARAETLALGPVPNVAARIQAIADPGSVWISAATQRLVSGLFVTEELGDRALAGHPDPLILHRAVQASGVRGRIHAAAATRPLTPFVGREQERQLLLDRWELAQEGEGQVVLITGEAGIGKSRLVERLKEELGASAHTWIETAGSPYLQHTPFAPVVDLMKQGFRWPADLGMAERVASLERSLELMGMTHSRVVPLLAPLLGLELPERYPPLPLTPEEQRRRMIAAIVEWTLAAARLQPTVIVMEDLHWVDPSTLELETLLADQIATSRVLLILTARPEFRAPWPLRSHHAQISLARLSRRHTRELIGSASTRAFAESELLEALVARTDGVPLFAEELARAVQESGEAAASVDIPATLQDTLMARLDRLGAARSVAQVGAVLGREFSFANVCAVAALPEAEAAASLAKLCEAELLHARGLAAEASYTFKHALVQQAAYESLLRSRRRELHRRAAEVLEAADAPETLLAQHWELAGDAAKAVDAWQAAAERARRSAASFEAAENFRRALAALASQPESTERDERELALQYQLMAYLIIARGESPELHAARERGRQLAARVSNVDLAVDVLSASWALAVVRGQWRSSRAIAEQMLEMSERAPSVRLRVKVHADAAMSCLVLGDLTSARAHGERVLELYDAAACRDDPLDRRILALNSLSQSATIMGRIAEGRRLATEMVKASQERRVATEIALATTQSLTCAAILREFEGMVDTARRQEEFCAEHHLDMFRVNAVVSGAWALGRLGETERAIPIIEQTMRHGFSPVASSMFRVLLAELQASASRLDDALATVDEGLAARTEDFVYRTELLRCRGDVLAQQGTDLAGAEASYREAIAADRASGSVLYELRAALGLSRLLARTARTGEARELVESVYARFGDDGICPDGRAARALLVELGG